MDWVDLRRAMVFRSTRSGFWHHCGALRGHTAFNCRLMGSGSRQRTKRTSGLYKGFSKRYYLLGLPQTIYGQPWPMPCGAAA